MRKIGLFGGSFDPIHNAHIEVAKIALKQLALDEIQLIPTLNNPWKDKNCVSAHDRINMIQLAISDQSSITINTIELESQSQEKNYTIDTIIKLKKKHPDYECFYIMGMDQANAFHKWKEAKKISQMVQLVAFQRGGYTVDLKMIEEYHFIILNNPPVFASSSEVRSGHIEMLDKKVLEYITSKGLYLETIVFSRMSKKRWLHTCSVAKLASQIAMANQLDEKKAYIAGMLHDIAKEMDYEESLALMKRFYPQYVHKPVAIWHQWLSSYVSENEFLVKDKEILKAIEDHTTASITISPIGKCVYVADKLDPLRGYDSSNQIKKCKKNIHEGFKDELIHFYQFSKEKERNIDDCFYEIYDYFIGKGEK
jgi:nicotinate (nicotinamide) nucleotide adenylyltransferase/putative HD superfamily hydrolase of NAD metabolism